MTTPTPVQASGFVIIGLGTIDAYGPTADAAWADFANAMQQANIRVLADGADSSEEQGSWTRRSGMTLSPATAALLAHVEVVGGNTSWGEVGGVICTVAEEAEAYGA